MSDTRRSSGVIASWFLAEGLSDGTALSRLVPLSRTKLCLGGVWGRCESARMVLAMSLLLLMVLCCCGLIFRVEIRVD